MRGRQESKRLTVTMVKGIALLGLLSLFVVMLVMLGIYRPMLQQQTLEAAASTGQILASQIDVAVQSVVGYSDFYVDSPELRNALEGYEQTPGETAETAVRQVLTQMQPSGIANIYNALVLRDGLFLTAASPLTQADKNMLNADWTFHIKDGTAEEEFSPFYDQNSAAADQNRILYLRNFTVEDTRYTLGLICSASQIEQDILRLSEGLFSGFAIATREGPMFFQFGELSDSSGVLGQHANDLSFKDRDQTGYYIADTVLGNGWKIIAYLSNEQFDACFVPVMTAALLMCLLVCAVLILLVIPFSHWLLKPIGILRDAMERATKGDMDVRIALRPHNEIGQLGEYFNHMLGEIQTAREKELRSEHQSQQMKYDLLVSQINAHYIYNTMSSINSLARLGRNDDVIRVNSALIRILQNNLRIEGGEIFSTVQAELEAVQSYWSIESLRPNNQAEFVSQVEKEALPCPLLKSLLQPLVENCLRHGLLDEETGVIRGRILLTVKREWGGLRVCVQDNGKGISSELLKRLNEPQTTWQSGGRHIGIPNIKKRLFFVFQERATIRIISGEGTRVELWCPLDRPEQR